MRDEDGMILMILETLMTDPTNSSGKYIGFPLTKALPKGLQQNWKFSPWRGLLKVLDCRSLILESVIGIRAVDGSETQLTT